MLVLYDNSGREVTGTVGPLEEGTDLVLTCEVRGGKQSYRDYYLYTIPIRYNAKKLRNPAG